MKKKRRVYPSRMAIIFLFISILLLSFSKIGNCSSFSKLYQGYWDQKDEAQEQFVAQHYDVIITTIGPNHVATLRSYNKNLSLLYYFNFKGIHDYDPLWGQVIANNLLWRDATGNPIINKAYGWYLIDIRNPRWLDIVIPHLANKLGYYDGIALDEAMVLYSNRLSSMPSDYNEDEYYDTLRTSLNKIRKAFPSSFILFNGYKSNRGEEYNGMNLLDFANGISFESVTYDEQGMSIDREILLNKLSNFYTASTTLKKHPAFSDIGESWNTQKRLFSLANFLLASSPTSFYIYIGNNLTQMLQYYPEYEVNLGNPISSPADEQNVLVRYYEDGVVISNPNPTETTIYLSKFQSIASLNIAKLTIQGGGKWTSSGTIIWVQINSTTPIRMPAASGLILLYLR